MAYPTESVFGLGCDPMNAAAVARIIGIKRRDPEAGFILLACDISQIRPYLATDPESIPGLPESWPGPVSWVIPASTLAPEWITGNSPNVAVRVTAHPLAAALCKEFGSAIVSTSANRSGKAAARTTVQVRYRLGEVLDYILPGETGKEAVPSEIRDATTGAILRPAQK